MNQLSLTRSMPLPDGSMAVAMRRQTGIDRLGRTLTHVMHATRQIPVCAGTAGDPVKRPGFEQAVLEVWPLSENAFSATDKA